jgi:hypothetical protein
VVLPAISASVTVVRVPKVCKLRLQMSVTDVIA